MLLALSSPLLRQSVPRRPVPVPALLRRKARFLIKRNFRESTVDLVKVVVKDCDVVSVLQSMNEAQLNIVESLLSYAISCELKLVLVAFLILALIAFTIR